MDSLQSCLTVREVKEQLLRLPKDLEATYERILTASPRPHDVLRLLQCLSFSARELRIEEFAEFKSVDLDAVGGPCYDPDLKYENSVVALSVCSGLVTESDGE